MPTAKKRPASPPPTITRREVEFHQAVARGKAAREASQRGFDPKALNAVLRGATPQVCKLADCNLEIGPLTLQVQLCLSEYALLVEQAVAAGVPAVSAEKKLLHYVAMFADPTMSWEMLTDYTAKPEARFRDFDGLAFDFAAVLGKGDNVALATRHLMTELGLLHESDPAPDDDPPGKPTGVARRTRPRRRKVAAPPRAG